MWNHLLARLKMQLGAIEMNRDDVRLERHQVVGICTWCLVGPDDDMRASTYNVLGTVAYHSETVERLRSPGDCMIAERGGVTRQLVMKCPDGCGEIILVNLDCRSGPAWRLYKRRGMWSLFPSIDKPEGCASHFILSYGKVILQIPIGRARIGRRKRSRM